MKIENGEWDHSFDEVNLAQRLLAAYTYYRDDCGGMVVGDAPPVALPKALSRVSGIKALVRHSVRPLRGKRRGNADQWLAKLNAIIDSLEGEYQKSRDVTPPPLHG
jgi:hypothetical protein